MDFQGFDYKQIGIYIVLTEINELGLSKFVPVRVLKKGVNKNKNFKSGDKISKHKIGKMVVFTFSSKSKTNKRLC